ncbi:DUF421 domain-containing protein [Camelliibacillus cellulosilyticus]
MGKREIGQLSLVDFVVSIMIAELAVISIEDPKKPMVATVMPIVLLLLIQLFLSIVSLKNAVFRRLIDGKPSTIIKKGEIDEHQMRRQRYNFDDLLMQLREHNIKSIGDVEFAILEPNGKLSVLRKTNEHELKEEMPEENASLPLPLVLDGKVQEENLKAIDKTPLWLRQELRKIGYRDLKKLSYCVLDQNGTFFVDLKDDHR